MKQTSSYGKKPEKCINDTRRGKILLTATRLFVEQGYDNTGMRQIAEEAGVSLSLASYHFGSKKEIAKRLILGHLRAIQPYVSEHTGDDAWLFAATLLRLNYVLMNRPSLRQFYMDMLLNDIYLEALASGNVEKERQRELSQAQMYWVLSDSYILASVERALVLCPFTDLLDLDVPDYIIKNHVYHLPSGEPVRHKPEWYMVQSREIADGILVQHPHLYNVFNEIPNHVAEYM